MSKKEFILKVTNIQVEYQNHAMSHYATSHVCKSSVIMVTDNIRECGGLNSDKNIRLEITQYETGYANQILPGLNKVLQEGALNASGNGKRYKITIEEI